MEGVLNDLEIVTLTLPSDRDLWLLNLKPEILEYRIKSLHYVALQDRNPLQSLAG